MSGVGTVSEDSGVDGRMQGLHSTFEYLRCPGHIGHFGDRQPSVQQDGGRAAGGQEFPAQVDEASGQVDEAGFVVNRQQRVQSAHRAATGSSAITRVITST